ncbi:MAG TPA: hypothetical protein EYP43_03240, partial [Thermoplasmata archaeon]|nr:hypothetical protein [Thermoplasmata archaeon]
MEYVIGRDGEGVLPGDDGGGYDAEHYVVLLADAAEVLLPFNIDREMIRRRFIGPADGPMDPYVAGIRVDGEGRSCVSGEGRGTRIDR